MVFWLTGTQGSDHGNAAIEDIGDMGLNGFRRDVEATIPALRRYARALTRDTETADDLVQDTLVRALRFEHLFNGGDLRSWLYTILTNLNRNRLRSLARRPAFTPIEDDDAPDMSGPEAGGRDIERALATLMSRLARARAQIRAYLAGERPALRRVK
jgi:RNA polymerase sigma-70 factor (ECF subfamily)